MSILSLYSSRQTRVCDSQRELFNTIEESGCLTRNKKRLGLRLVLTLRLGSRVGFKARVSSTVRT